MTTVVFGKRGLAPSSPARPAPLRQSEPAAAPAKPAELEEDDAAERLFAAIPFLTGGLILLLGLVFLAEKRFAFDMGKGGVMSVHSLVAFGAASYDRVIGQHEVWRIFLAPLLHASDSHIIGNSIALGLLGYLLESRIGRGWYALIFAFSALTGIAGSLLGNPHNLTTVGASGAITGLLAAVFVISFHKTCDPQQRAAMRKWSLRLGVPALGPLLWGAHGSTDYFAHLGGAIGGGMIALGLLVSWSGDTFRPLFARTAAGIAAFALLGSAVSASFAANQFAMNRTAAADFIPLQEMPDTFDAGSKASDLLQRFPKDPRAHLFAAQSCARNGNGFSAEHELRATISLASDPNDRKVQALAQAYLALILAGRHNWREAGDLAKGLCKSPDAASYRKLLEKAKLCG